jgi:hypothetical protein
MSSIAISSIVFACVFGGALAGISLRGVLPKHHLASESRGVVTAGMGLVATLAALVLGLLIASAKGSYDSQSTEVTELSLADKIQELSPKNDSQRAIQSQAIREQRLSSVSMPVLAASAFVQEPSRCLCADLLGTALFVSFGLFAPFNTTTIASLFVSALSVSGAIFLILEMYTPYAGLIQISSAPLRAALAQLGQ